MFKRFIEMWNRLINSGHAMADTLDEGNAKLRSTLGLTTPRESRALPAAQVKDARRPAIGGRKGGDK